MPGFNQLKMTRQLFANINNDVFIAGTQSLEGAGREPIEFLRALLDNKGIEPGGGSSVLLSDATLKKKEAGFESLNLQVTSMLESTNLIDTLREKLCAIGGKDKAKLHDALKAGVEPIVDKILAMPLKADSKERASVLMPGGWAGESGESGHALVYEFKRDQEGNLLFFVYNSGAGIESYHETVVSGEDNKRRYKTMRCYKIPAEKKIDRNNLKFFISELVKPRIFPLVKDKVKSDKIEYNAKELYKRVFRQIAHLNGEAITASELHQLDPNYNDDLVSIGQRSGTCAEKSLHELIKHSIQDQKIAKLIIFSLKLYSIELFLNDTEALGKNNDEQSKNEYAKNLHQLELAKQKLAKKLSKIMIDHEKHRLPYEVEEIQKRAKKAIDRVEILSLEKNKEITYFKQSIGTNAPSRTATNLWYVTLDGALDPLKIVQSELEQKDQQEKKEEKDYAKEACQAAQFSMESFKDFKDSLEILKQEGRYAEIEQKIFFYLTNFPLTSEYLQTINSTEDAIQYVNGMQYLLSQYAVAAKNSKNYADYNQLTPKMVAAILSATEAIDLVCQHEKFNFLGGMALHGIENFFNGTFNHFKKTSGFNPYLATENPRVDARIQAILSRESTMPYAPRVNLDGIKAYLNSPEKADLKKHLETLYEENIDKTTGLPKFTEIEKRLIRTGGYESVVAYLHYLELKPGDFPEDAKRVTLYKTTEQVCKNVFGVLNDHQFKGALEERSSVKKFIRKSFGGESLVYEQFSERFQLNRERSIRHFNKITSTDIEATLTDQFLYQRSDSIDDNYVSNKIYSHKDEGIDKLFKHLRYLRTDPNVQFSTTIDFFQKNLDLFSSKGADEKETKKCVERKNDMQQYLRRNIFQTGVLVRAIYENERSLTCFHEFIKKAILYYGTTENDFDNVLYFYQLQADVDKYVLNIPGSPEDLKNNIKALQFETLEALNAVDLNKIKTESDKYRFSKIKLQLALNADKAVEPKVLFDLLIEVSTHHRNTEINSNEDREAYKRLVDLAMEKLQISQNKIGEFAFAWAKEQGLLQSYSYESFIKLKRKGSYPHFFYYDESGKKILSIDLTEGHILAEGKYVCFPPMMLQNLKLYQEMFGKEQLPKLTATVYHVTNAEITNYEIQGSMPPARFVKREDIQGVNRQVSGVAYQAEKTVEGQTKFYEKRSAPTPRKDFSLWVTPENSYSVNQDFPETFYGQDTTFWVSVGEQANTLIERNNARYFIKDGSHEVQELDEVLDKDNKPIGFKPTGFSLVSDLSKVSPALDAICAKFEHKAFMEVLVKKAQAIGSIDDEIKIKFPRYGLELIGKYDTQQQKWIVHLADNPDLVLVDSSEITLSQAIPNGLIFEDLKSKKEVKRKKEERPEKAERTLRRVIYTPNQSYYADKPDKAEGKLSEHDNLQSRTVYHQPILDQTNINRRLELKWTINKPELKTPQIFLGTPSRPAGAITYTNSEKYFTYTVNTGKKEVVASSNEEQLYLAYLNLINIKPKLALKNIQNIIVKNGGLKGTVEELEVIDKIINGAPRLASQIDSPEFVAVRTHVLSLVSNLIEAKNRSAKVSQQQEKGKEEEVVNVFSIPNSKEISESTFDNYVKKKHYETLENLQSSLPGLIKEHCLKAINLKSNTAKELRLSDVQLDTMLSGIGLDKEVTTDEIRLKEKYIDKKNWYRARESDIKAQQARRDGTEEKAAAEYIEAAVINPIVNRLEADKHTINLPNGKQILGPMPQGWPDINKLIAEGQSKIDSALAQRISIENFLKTLTPTLAPGMSNEDLLRNFIPIFQLVISKSQDEKIVAEQKHLHEFLENVLRADCSVEQGTEKSIFSAVAATLLVASKHKDAFENTHMNDLAHYEEKYNRKTFGDTYALDAYKKERHVDYVDAIFKRAYEKQEHIQIDIKQIKREQAKKPQELHIKTYIPGQYKSEPISITMTEDAYNAFSNEKFIQRCGLSNFCIEMKNFEDKAQTQESSHKDKLKEIIQEKSKKINEAIQKRKEKSKEDGLLESKEKTENLKLSLFKESADAKQKAEEEIGKIRNGLENDFYKTTKTTLTMPGSREKILEECKIINASIKTKIENDKALLLKLANKGPKNAFKQAQYELKKSAFKRKPLDLRDLNRLFILADMKEYRRVTGLGKDDIQDLHNQMSVLINDSILKTRYKNIAKELKKIERFKIRFMSNNKQDFDNNIDAIKDGKEIFITKNEDKFTIHYKKKESGSIDQFDCDAELNKSLLSLNLNKEVLLKKQESEEIYERIYAEVAAKGGYTRDIQADECVAEVTELGKMLAARNMILPNGETDYQFFQKEEKMLIRLQQKFYLDKLLHKNKKTGKFDNCVIQLIMGGGKSKVIGPLAALKKADGTNLVIFEVKNSLLDVNFSDMRATSERLFNQKAVLFDFDRNSKSSSRDLQKIYDLFVQTSIDKNYIVTSGSCLQALQLKYKETLGQRPILEEKDNPQKNAKWEEEIKEWKEQTKLFRQLLLLLKQKGDRIIDEVHDELDPIRELNYTIGASSRPSKEDIQTSVNFFYFLNNVVVESVKDKKTTVLDLVKNNKDAKLIGDYDTEIPKIMQTIASTLVSDQQNSPISKIVKKLQSNSVKNTDLIAYLLDTDDSIYEILESKLLTDAERRQLAFIKAELSKILPLTLVRNYNEHYGPSRKPNLSAFEKKRAIPYRGPNMPSEGSEFGLPIESINYTIQMNLIEDLSEELVSEVINDYLHRARTELLDSKNGKFENTQAYRDFKDKFGKIFPEGQTNLRKISLLSQTADNEAWGNILKKFQVSPEFKKAVLEDHVLPLVKINPKVLTSNSQNLASMTRTTQCMSGTPYNYRVFHQDISFDEYEGLGTDGETIQLLKDRKKDVKVIMCNNYKSAERLLTEVLSKEAVENNQNLKNVRAIIDVGALFKEETSNLNVARSIRSYFQANDERLGSKTKWVIYFDNNRNKLCALSVEKDKTMNDSEIVELGTSDEKVISEKLKCEPEERFTYFDQARTTGLDLKQAANAQALVTFSEHTTQSALLQGVKRMRQFNITNNQSVMMVGPAYMENRLARVKLPKNIDKKMDDPLLKEGETKNDDAINVGDVLAFANKNHVDLILPIHFKGAVQKIQETLHEELFGRVLNTDDPDRQHELDKLFSSIFSKVYEPDHFKTYGSVNRPTPSFEYFDKLKAIYYKEWKRLLTLADIQPSKDEKDRVKKTLEKITKSAIEDCDDTILSKPLKKMSADKVQDNLGSQNEAQHQVEVTQEEQTKIQTATAVYEEHPWAFDTQKFEFKGFSLDSESSDFQWRDTETVVLVDSVLRREHGILFSLDKNIYFSNRQARTINQRTAYYDEYVKPMPVVMMIASKTKPNDFKCVSLTMEELPFYTNKTKEELKNAYPNEDIWFVTSDGEPVYGSPPATLPALYDTVLEQVKFINGDVREIAQQENGIVWLTKETNAKMQFLETVSLPRLPEKAQFYHSLKSRLDVAGNIKKEMLNAPFENYVDMNWQDKYPMFDKLEKTVKEKIQQFALALNEINSSYENDFENTRLESKYDEDVIKDINHHKEQVLDKRTEIINAICSGDKENLLFLMHNEEYAHIDLNFTTQGKNLVDFAIESGNFGCLIYCMPRINLKEKNKENLTNLELIVKSLSAAFKKESKDKFDIKEILDLENIKKYVVYDEGSSMNLICLALKYNLPEMLNFIVAIGLESFESLEQLNAVISLTKNIGFVENQSTSSAKKSGKSKKKRNQKQGAPENSEKSNLRTVINALPEQYKKTKKYRTQIIKSYINNPDNSVMPDFDNAVSLEIFDEMLDKHLVEKIIQNLSLNTLTYFKKIGALKSLYAYEKNLLGKITRFGSQSLKGKDDELNKIVDLLWEEGIRGDDTFAIAVSNKLSLSVLKNLYSKIREKAFNPSGEEGVDTPITIAMSLNDLTVLENIKETGGEAVRIKIEMLSKPFGDYVNWKSNPSYKVSSLSDSEKNQITCFSKALQENNKMLKDDDGVERKITIEERNDPEIRGLLWYHRQNVYKKRKKIVDCIRARGGLEFILTPEYQNIDLNFVLDGKNLIEIALESKNYNAITFLLKNDKLSFESKKGGVETNLGIIVKHVNQHREGSQEILKEILDREMLEKYIAHPDEGLNLLSLSVAHKNSALLKMVFNHHMYLFENKASEKFLKKISGLYASVKEVGVLLGSETQPGSLLHKHQHSRYYVTKTIKNYIQDEKSTLDFKQPLFSTIDIEIFDKAFFDNILMNNNPKTAEVLGCLRDRGVFSDLRHRQINVSFLENFIQLHLSPMLENTNDSVSIEIINILKSIQEQLEKLSDNEELPESFSKAYNKVIEETFLNAVDNHKSWSLVQLLYKELSEHNIDGIVKYISETHMPSKSSLEEIFDEQDIKDFIKKEDLTVNFLALALKHKNAEMLEMIKDKYLNQFESFGILKELIEKAKEKFPNIDDNAVNNLIGDSNTEGSVLYAYLHSKEHVIYLINNFLEKKTESDFFDKLPFLSLKNDIFDRDFVESTLNKPNADLIAYFTQKGVFSQLNMSLQEVLDKILALPSNSVDDASFKSIVNSLCKTPEEKKNAFANRVYKLLSTKERKIILEGQPGGVETNLELFVYRMGKYSSDKSVELKTFFDEEMIKAYLNNPNENLNLLCLAVKCNANLLKEICDKYLHLFASSHQLEEILGKVKSTLLQAKSVLPNEENSETKQLLESTGEIDRILHQYQNHPSGKYVLDTLRDYINGEFKGKMEEALFKNPPFSNVNTRVFDQALIDLVFKKPNMQVLDYLKEIRVFNRDGIKITDDHVSGLLKADNISEDMHIQVLDILIQVGGESISRCALGCALEEKKSNRIVRHCYTKLIAPIYPDKFSEKNAISFLLKEDKNEKEDEIIRFIDAFWDTEADKKEVFSIALNAKKSDRILKHLCTKLLDSAKLSSNTFSTKALKLLQLAFKGQKDEIVGHIVNYMNENDLNIKLIEKRILERDFRTPAQQRLLAKIKINQGVPSLKSNPPLKQLETKTDKRSPAPPATLSLEKTVPLIASVPKNIPEAEAATLKSVGADVRSKKLLDTSENKVLDEGLRETVPSAASAMDALNAILESGSDETKAAFEQEPPTQPLHIHVSEEIQPVPLPIPSLRIASAASFPKTTTLQSISTDAVSQAPSDTSESKTELENAPSKQPPMPSLASVSLGADANKNPVLLLMWEKKNDDELIQLLENFWSQNQGIQQQNICSMPDNATFKEKSARKQMALRCLQVAINANKDKLVQNLVKDINESDISMTAQEKTPFEVQVIKKLKGIKDAIKQLSIRPKPKIK